MKKHLLLILPTLVGIAAKAQIPTGYYNNADGKTGTELRQALHDIIDEHTTISYNQLWTAFWTTDNKGNNVVWDMYSDGANYSYSYYSKTGDQCGNYDSEGDCYNREHSWPKSWFDGKESSVPGRDLHHIFPTDGYVNAQRSNYPFGEVNNPTWTSQNGSKLGPCSTSGYSGTAFEPIDEYKGDFARAYFYMSTRYYGEDSGWSSSGMTDKSEILPWALTMLLNWSDNDPVSQKEIDRNEAVYGIQGNRNPFIDHPEYAHLIWEPGWSGTSYAITCTAVYHGTINAPETAVAGTLVSLTATPAQGYMLDSWTVYKTDDQSTTVEVSGNGTFTMPAFNVTVSASFVAKEDFTAHYYLVTSTDQLEAGRTYLIVNTTAGKALSTTQNSNNRNAADVTIGSNNVIESIGNTVCELTLGGSTGAWTFYDGTNNGYLYAASSSNNHLKTQTTNDANGQWSIAITQDGTATIVSQGSNTINNLRYNPNGNSPIFSCYASTSGFAKVELYIRSEENEYTSDATLACLNSFDKSVIRSGVTVSANSVLGIDQTTDPSLVIIEEGGQLIHQATGLKATLKKSIQAYSSNQSDGWYTIAVPFTEFTPTQVATGNYDLYAYDEDATAEWINFKSESPFPTATATGYLYAHSPSTTLRMTGTLNIGTYSETVNLSYGNDHADIRGFNLLGNPTAHDITFSKTGNVSDGYYYLNDSENWVYQTGSSVPVGRGFLVKANDSGQSVTLNPQSKDIHNDKEEYLAIDIDGEKAYVKLNEGVSMPLLSFRDHSSSLWLERDRQPYVMLVRDNANSVELNYKAQRPGLHLLSVDAKGLDLDYLHLIDRLTSADIDLLQTPSYGFESASNDYASRFQLVFTDNGTETGDDFAFISNGELVVNGTGTVVVVDMLGRSVFTHEVNSTFRTPHSAFPAPGVYVLRLITQEKVRTQKLIVH